MADVHFVVEQAGCSSCAARIRASLEAIATVEVIEIDESADVASVSLADSSGLAEDAVVAALRHASKNSGHEYRVQAGSWIVAHS